jgi:CelD/BcsL family acetyltransferase involved in cellulose biosynthesis
MTVLPTMDIPKECTENGYAIETIASDDGLRTLETDWNRLSECSEPHNAFATFGWYMAWARHYAEQESSERFRPEVLVFRSNKAVVGIAPLVRRETTRLGFSVRRLEFVTIHADYNQLMVGADRGGLTSALVKHLARTAELWDVIDLRDLPDGETGTTVASNAFANAGLIFRITAENHRCPCLSLETGGAEQQMARLSGHVRRVLRKRCTQAAEQGARVRIIEHPETEPGLLETMIQLERDKHERSEFPPFVAPLERVFAELFKTLGPRGWLYVALLEKDGEPIAFQLGFRCGDKLWDYNKAYGRAHAKLAPGTLLVLALFDYGFTHGFREYDFLRGEEEYKLVWSTESRSRSRILVWNRRAGSRLKRLVYFDLKPAVYRLMGGRA